MILTGSQNILPSPACNITNISRNGIILISDDLVHGDQTDYDLGSAIKICQGENLTRSLPWRRAQINDAAEDGVFTLSRNCRFVDYQGDIISGNSYSNLTDDAMQPLDPGFSHRTTERM